MYYGISTTGLIGGQPFSESGFLPAPPLPGFDATKWFDPTCAAPGTGDELLIGCVVTHGSSSLNTRLALWRNPSGTGTLELNTPTAAAGTSSYLDDKPWLAIGPYLGGGDHVYAAYTRRYPTVPSTCLDILM